MHSFTRMANLSFVAVMFSLLATIGCGNSAGSSILTSGSGNFSSATLNGSYVYQVHGWVPNAQGTALVPYREVGVFTADGNGNITSGTDDSSVSANGTAITGGYSVSSDGIGSITFNTSSFGTSINFGITVAGSSRIQMIEADNFLNAGGIAELQDSSAAATTPSGTFVFRLHQEASANNTNDEASQVGAFNLSNSGAGAMDQDLNGSFTTDSITVALNAPTGGGRGTGTLDDTTATFVTPLVYYVVNSSELALLVNLGAAVGSGSAEAQSGVSSGTGLSGSYAFGSRGDDLNTGPEGIATVGQFTATSGSISGTQDVMQDLNNPVTQNFSACYSSGSAGGINGRVTMVVNGSAPCTATPTQVVWMVSPNRAFFIDNSGLTFQDGTADLQTSNSFSAATLKGQFALTMDGLDLLNSEALSRTGTMQFDGSGNLNFAEEANGTSLGLIQQVLTGTYSVSSNGRATGSVSGGQDIGTVVLYAVSSSQAYVLQTDAEFITSGTLVLQQQ